MAARQTEENQPMSRSEDLERFVEAAKSRGAPDEAVLLVLAEAGWPEREVRRALARYYVSALGPPPSRGPKSGASAHPLDAFLYVVASGSLIAWVSSVLVVVGYSVDRAFGVVGPGGETAWRIESLLRAVATLIVTAPLYLGLLAVLRSRLRAGITAPNSPPRVWVLSGTLVIGVTTLLGFLVDAIADLLMGESTIASSIKTAISLALVGALTAAYLRWLQGPIEQEAND